MQGLSPCEGIRPNSCFTAHPHRYRGDVAVSSASTISWPNWDRSGERIWLPGTGALADATQRRGARGCPALDCPPRLPSGFPSRVRPGDRIVARLRGRLRTVRQATPSWKMPAGDRSLSVLRGPVEDRPRHSEGKREFGQIIVVAASRARMLDWPRDGASLGNLHGITERILQIRNQSGPLRPHAQAPGHGEYI